MNRHILPAVICLHASLACAVDFKSQVAPVLKQYCYKCHSEAEKKEKGKLALDNLTKFATKIGDGARRETEVGGIEVVGFDAVVAKMADAIDARGIEFVETVGAVDDERGLAAKFFNALSDEGVNVLMISTSEIRIAALVPLEQLQDAVRALHTAYGLDAEQVEAVVYGGTGR